MSLDQYIFIEQDSLFNSIEDQDSIFLKDAMGIVNEKALSNITLNKEVCYWRKHFRLNEFIFDNIFKKRLLYKEQADKRLYDKSYILLTLKDILLIESNKEDIIERSIKYDKEYLKQIDLEFFKKSKFALKRGLLVMYYPVMYR